MVERLAIGTVSLLWLNPPGGTPGEQTNDGEAVIRSLTFTPVMTSNANNYTCVAVVLGTSSGNHVKSGVGTLFVKSNVKY